MLSRVLESATIFTAVHTDLTGIPKDHHWDMLFPTVLWVSMLSCLTYFTNHPQTTHHIPLRCSTYMLSTGSPQGCVLPKSWGLRTLQSAAFFLSVNTTVMQKVQQQLHFHILRRNRVEQRLLMSFYFITIWSLQAYSITVWDVACTAADKKKHREEVRSAEKNN